MNFRYSFLPCAREGVAAISHILVKDAPASLILIENEAGPQIYTPGCDVDKERLVYVGNMNGLKHRFMAARPA